MYKSFRLLVKTARYRGGSRTAVTSKMELFVIIVNGFHLPASMLDVATVSDLLL